MLTKISRVSGANKLFITFQHEKKTFLCTRSHVVHSVYSINTNELPNHFTLLFFLVDFSSHCSEKDAIHHVTLATVIFSNVKITCSHAKGHLVF